MKAIELNLYKEVTIKGRWNPKKTKVKFPVYFTKNYDTLDEFSVEYDYSKLVTEDGELFYLTTIVDSFVGYTIRREFLDKGKVNNILYNLFYNQQGQYRLTEKRIFDNKLKDINNLVKL